MLICRQICKEEKFGVLWHLNLQEKLEDKGVNFNQKYHILDVCNPVEAKRVLAENSLVGYFLPYKIVVFAENGGTKIGLPKPTSLIGLLESENLIEIAGVIEKRLIACIEKSR